MHSGFAILLQLILVIGHTFTEETLTTLSPYSVIDYRIPLMHPQLMAVVDPRVGLKYYLDKLNIDYPMDDLEPIRKTILFGRWNRDFDSWKLLSRYMYACELTKTRISNMKFKYEDSVTDFGKTGCYNQCLAENEEYFKFLSNRLQDLTYKNPIIDVALNAPTDFSGEKKISQCTRVDKEVYRCDCYYENYQIKVGPEFENLFGKILFEAREATTQKTDKQELEEKYGVPMKLMGFLIVYHMLPQDMFTYLLWWTASENPTTDEK